MQLAGSLNGPLVETPALVRHNGHTSGNESRREEAHRSLPGTGPPSIRLSGAVGMEQKTSFLRLEKGRVGGYEEYDEIPLRGTTVIGRSSTDDPTDAERPDLEVKDDFVSRGHARIYYSQEKAAYVLQERDGGTKNGTFLNGERLQPDTPHQLKDGDVIGLAMAGQTYRLILRFREQPMTLLEIDASQMTQGNLVVDTKARRVWVGGNEVSLRRKEYDLLAYLYDNCGSACSRDEISKVVWADEGGIISEETIDSTMHRLREKIEPHPSNPRYLVTLPRYGYRLDL